MGTLLIGRRRKQRGQTESTSRQQRPATRVVSAERRMQRRFRWINERILDCYPARSPLHVIDFVCECPDPHCFATTPLVRRQFDRIRSGEAFAISTRHGDDDSLQAAAA